jgi:hypothetical protein
VKRQQAFVLAFALRAAALAGAASGCESVPVLTFAGAGGSVDATDTGAADVDAPESGPDDVEVGPEAGCPENPPPGTSVCCGAVACEGLCAGQCDACAAKCTAPGESCCAKNNNVLCLSAGSICH